MFKKGLTSVTFRKKEPLQIIQLAKRAGMQSIEWGADVHVPPDDLDYARWVGKKTREAGLEVAGYGSYFATGKQEPEEFERILQTAVTLKAPVIRVWAGWEPSQTAEITYQRKVIDCTRIICDMAARQGILVAYEYHHGTLTDDASYAVKMMHEIGKDNMRLYWQPDDRISHLKNCEALKMILPYLQNVHVFKLDADRKRLALEKGSKEWNDYAGLLKKSSSTHNVLIEFVKDDSEEQFMQDANFLNELFK